MTDDDKPTWRQAQRDAEQAAADRFAEAVECGEDLDCCGDYAHEYADSSPDVIYTYRARAIWADDSEVRDHEDEANGMDPNASIDQRIGLCVYFALVNEFLEAWHELRLRHDSEVAA